MVVLSFDGLSFSFDGPMVTGRPLCITYHCAGEVTCPCVGEVSVTGPCVGGVTCPSVGDLPHRLILHGFCQQSRKTMNSKDLKALIDKTLQLAMYKS